jgi:hypothetical protein
MKWRIYKSYSFIDKDPFIYDYGAFLSKQGKTPAEIDARGGPRAQTQHNWFYGETRQPKFSSMRAAVRAAGGDIVIVNGLRKVTDFNRNEIAGLMPRKKKKAVKKAKRRAVKKKT